MKKESLVTVALEATTSKKILSAFGVSLVLGAGYGMIVESHTNEVAEGKIITAETCLDVIPHDGTVTDELDECFDSGVPGGNSIDKDAIDAGQPIEYVEAYIKSQEAEADKIEPGRIAAWSLAPAATLGFVTIFLAD